MSLALALATHPEALSGRGQTGGMGSEYLRAGKDLSQYKGALPAEGHTVSQRQHRGWQSTVQQVVIRTLSADNLCWGRAWF